MSSYRSRSRKAVDASNFISTPIAAIARKKNANENRPRFTLLVNTRTDSTGEPSACASMACTRRWKLYPRRTISALRMRLASSASSSSARPVVARPRASSGASGNATLTSREIIQLKRLHQIQCFHTIDDVDWQATSGLPLLLSGIVIVRPNPQAIFYRGQQQRRYSAVVPVAYKDVLAAQASTAVGPAAHHWARILLRDKQAGWPIDAGGCAQVHAAPICQPPPWPCSKFAPTTGASRAANLQMGSWR